MLKFISRFNRRRLPSILKSLMETFSGVTNIKEGENVNIYN